MGFKVFGGVALFPDLLLPVSTGIRCTNKILEAGELIKNVFERCRFLLPVCSYEGFNFFTKWWQNFFGAKKFSASLIQTKLRLWVGGDLLQKLWLFGSSEIPV